MNNIRIISIPPSEAPEAVRQAWVELPLPLADGEQNHRPATDFRVLSGPNSILLFMLRLLCGCIERVDGYVVDTQTTIKVMQETSPKAACWWLTNTRHLLKYGRKLVFHPHLCQTLEP